MTDLAQAFAHRGVTAEWRLPGGHRNDVWLVRMGQVPLVAKTTRHSEAGLQWLLPILDAARGSGLGAPDLIPDGEGRLGGGGITLEPFIEGKVPDRPGLHRLGPRLRRFHARTAGLRPRPGTPAAGDARSSRGPIAAVHALRRALSQLPPARPVAVHGDLNPTNVLLTPSGPVLIDWDEARMDHPAFDFPLAHLPAHVRRARLAWEIVSGWSEEPVYARRLAARFPRNRRTGR